MDWVLIGLLGTGLAAVIALLGTALFQLRGTLDGIRRDLTDVTARIAAMDAALQAHIAQTRVVGATARPVDGPRRSGSV